MIDALLQEHDRSDRIATLFHSSPRVTCRVSTFREERLESHRGYSFSSRDSEAIDVDRVQAPGAGDLTVWPSFLGVSKKGGVPKWMDYKLR